MSIACCAATHHQPIFGEACFLQHTPLCGWENDTKKESWLCAVLIILKFSNCQLTNPGTAVGRTSVRICCRPSVFSLCMIMSCRCRSSSCCSAARTAAATCCCTLTRLLCCSRHRHVAEQDGTAGWQDLSYGNLPSTIDMAACT